EQNNYKVLLDEIHHSERIIELKIGAALPYVALVINAINRLNKYPNVNITFFSGNTDEIEQMLYLNEIDVAIITAKEMDQNPNIYTAKYYGFNNRLYANNDSRLFENDNLSFADLKDKKFICSNYSVLHNTLTKLLEKHNIIPNIYFKSNEVASSFFLEFDDDTVVILPEFVAPYYKTLKPLPLDTAAFDAKALVAIKKGRKFPKKEKMLLDEYVKELDKLFGSK
ncbi:MAG: LysR family transcriptional regulator substrate-binding protein, partial [Clostridia bacterium]|nr:LysR family transcriptional regulator substrate-binding protein [Clostridia bacterium]